MSAPREADLRAQATRAREIWRAALHPKDTQRLRELQAAATDLLPVLATALEACADGAADYERLRDLVAGEPMTDEDRVAMECEEAIAIDAILVRALTDALAVDDIRRAAIAEPTDAAPQQKETP